MSAGCTESALFVRRPEDLGPGPERIYIGDETCELRLPGEDMLSWLEAPGTAADRSLTLVTPPLTDAGLARLEELLPRLARARSAGLEVVVNDLGALELLRGRGVEPVCGRLLSGRYMQFPAFPDEFLEFLAGRGVRRMEINSREQLQATRDQLRSRGLRTHFHWPYMFVAATRLCACADGCAGHPRDALAACARGCERRLATYTVGGAELLVLGNALWTRHPGPAQPPAETDRLVSDERRPVPPEDGGTGP